MTEKEMFEKYEEIRSSGKYNMITDANLVMAEMDIEPVLYYYIVMNYSLLKDKYGGKSDDRSEND